MQIILASAKIMHDRLKSRPDIILSSPRFENEVQAFARDLAQYPAEMPFLPIMVRHTSI